MAGGATGPGPSRSRALIHVRVIFLGKQRYVDRPSVARFLSSAGHRGHEAELLDRDALLATSLADYDVVLAKSHYKDPLVRQHLRGSHAIVINDLEATARCETRSNVAACLDDGGVSSPRHIRSVGDRSDMALPWIAKPNQGGDHTLTIIHERPECVDLDATFYQQLLPISTVMKVYSIGDHHDVVRLDYPHAGITNPTRTRVGTAGGHLAEAAARIGAATGLSIFNTDFIEIDDTPYAIDVNPFPRLDPVPSAHELLWDLIDSTLAQRG